MPARFKHGFHIRWLDISNCEVNDTVDSYKYGYSGYGTRFDAQSQFTLSNGKWDKTLLFLELTAVLPYMIII